MNLASLPLVITCCVDSKRKITALFMFYATNYKQCKIYISADHFFFFKIKLCYEYSRNSKVLHRD